MAELTQLPEGFAIKGALTVETARALFSTPLTLSGKNLTMDLSDVSEIDSAGLSLLVYWKQYAEKQQYNLTFKNLPNQVVSMIKISNLESLMDVAA